MKSFVTPLCLILLCGSLAVADDPQIDTAKLFPSTVGSTWVYAVESKEKTAGRITNKVTKIETIDGQKLIRLESFVKDKVVASEHLAVVSDQGLFRHRINGSEATPPVLVIKFPLKADETWNTETTIGQETLTGESVVGFEEVEVPAGKYQTVRVKTNAKAGAQEIESTIWYAEGVGMVRQSFTLGDNTFSLKLEKFEETKAESKDDDSKN